MAFLHLIGKYTLELLGANHANDSSNGVCPARFDSVAVLGVDEHVWRHTRYGDKYVTVIIGFTPVRNKTGPARLLDVLKGRSTSL